MTQNRIMREVLLCELTHHMLNQTHYLAARKHNIVIVLAAQFVVYDIEKPQLVLMSLFCVKTIIVVIING